MTEAGKERIRQSRLGKKWSDDVKKKISETKKANPTRYWLGKKHILETKKKISETKKKSLTTIRGIKHHNWKGGVTSENMKVRGSLEYIIWREEVYKRDFWNCRICGIHCEKGNTVAHHLDKFSDFPELRFIVSNGLTLCRKCHFKIESPIINITHT